MLDAARRDADAQRRSVEFAHAQLAEVAAERDAQRQRADLAEATALANLQSASHWMAEAERAQQRADELVVRVAELEQDSELIRVYRDDDAKAWKAGDKAMKDALAQERAAHAVTREHVADLQTLVRAGRVELVVEQEAHAATRARLTVACENVLAFQAEHHAANQAAMRAALRKIKLYAGTYAERADELPELALVASIAQDALAAAPPAVVCAIPDCHIEQPHQHQTSAAAPEGET